MNDQARVTLNGAQRAALRRALTSNAGWRDWSRENGVKIESASATQLLNAAEWLSIDPQLYMSAQREESATASEEAPPVIYAPPPSSDNPATALASLIGQIAGQKQAARIVTQIDGILASL